jgi:hypothetical protein
MKEMVLPEDEMKIFNESLVTRLEDKNQQIKKWLTRWRQTNQQRQEYQENSRKGNTQEK